VGLIGVCIPSRGVVEDACTVNALDEQLCVGFVLCMYTYTDEGGRGGGGGGQEEGTACEGGKERRFSPKCIIMYNYVYIITL
jgi:hypothetical protein